MDNAIELKVYRHKVYKDIFLKRNWNVMGSADAEWWSATKELIEALQSMKTYEIGGFVWHDVEKEYKKHFYENGISELKAKITLEKEMEFDGYKGKMKKELILPLNDFELVILREVY